MAESSVGIGRGSTRQRKSGDVKPGPDNCSKSQIIQGVGNASVAANVNIPPRNGETRSISTTLSAVKKKLEKMSVNKNTLERDRRLGPHFYDEDGSMFSKSASSTNSNLSFKSGDAVKTKTKTLDMIPAGMSIVMSSKDLDRMSSKDLDRNCKTPPKHKITHPAQEQYFKYKRTNSVNSQTSDKCETVSNGSVSSTSSTSENNKSKNNDENVEQRPPSAASSQSSQECQADSVDEDVPLFSVNNPDENHVKLGCKCSDCKSWNVCGFDTTREVFEEKHAKTAVKPLTLIKSTTDMETDRIKTMTELFSKIVDMKKAVLHKVLAHGTDVPFPQHFVKDVPFIEAVQDGMARLRYKESKPIQAYVWPAIMRCRNVVMVHDKRTGKSMSYVPAICSFMLEKSERYKQLPNAPGPIAVILCPDAFISEDVYDLINTLMNKVKSRRKINIVLATLPLDKHTLSQFKQPCDILVATPIALLTLLSRDVFNMKRVCHLVVESLDVMLKNFNVAFKHILKITQEMLEHRTVPNQVQFIATSEHWTVPVETLVKSLLTVPLICIGNHMQSALYGRADIQIVDVKPELKLERLLEITKDSYLFYKSLIVCRQSEIEGISTLFGLYGIKMIAINEDMGSEEISECEKPWLNTPDGENFVLITTDKILNTYLKITTAALLINYSLPDTWTAFSKRFNYLLDKYSSPLCAQGPAVKIFAFIDDTQSPEFPRIVSFFQEIGLKVPNKVIEACVEYRRKDEEQKIKSNKNICKTLKSFGICTEIRCPFRHKLSKELDCYKWLPQEGKIKFNVLKVASVNKFLVQLTAAIDDKGEERKFSDRRAEIEECFKKSSCLEFVQEVSLNKWYVYGREDGYHRVVLRTILERDSITKLPSKVEVYAFDTGFTKYVSCADLYEMPEKLKTIPSIGVELIVSNIVPPNKSLTWCNKSRKIIIQALESHFNQENVVCVSTVFLQLANTLWVDDVRLEIYLAGIKETITEFSLVKFLRNGQMIEKDEEPLNLLRKLCEAAEIDVPKIVEKVIKAGVKQQQVMPQWAHLDEGYNDVYFCSAKNPHQFFVRLIKYDSIFKNLQKAIQEVIKQLFYKQLREHQIEVGKCYLAKDPEGVDYCRVLLTDVKDNLVNCYYVDYGDTAYCEKSELKFLSNEFITKLPFQAIECSLYGLLPPTESWPDSATDVLYHYAFETGTDFFRKLYIKYMQNEKGVFINNIRYITFLVDFCSDEPISLNEIILNRELAMLIENCSLDEIEFPEKQCELDIDIDDDTSEGEIKEFLTECEKQPEQEQYDDSFDNEEHFVDWDVEIFDKKAFFKQFLGVKQEEIKAKEESAKKCVRNSEEESNATCSKVTGFSEKLTPNIAWYQEEEAIKITVKLPGVTEYSAKVLMGRILAFSTNHDGKDYELNLQFYERVKKNIVHSAGGQVVRISLEKVNKNEWPRLLLSKSRSHYISYDYDKICIPEEKKRKFLDLGPDKEEENADADGYIDEIESDEWDDESDIEDDSDWE